MYKNIFTRNQNKMAYISEPIGIIPRSILKTLNRFFTQMFPNSNRLVIQEFRVSRYQVIVSVRCLCYLIFLPLLTNILSKNFLFAPLTQYIWNTQHEGIFLNSYLEKEALSEFDDFEQQLYFDYLISPEKYQNPIFAYKLPLTEDSFLLTEAPTLRQEKYVGRDCDLVISNFKENCDVSIEIPDQQYAISQAFPKMHELIIWLQKAVGFNRAEFENKSATLLSNLGDESDTILKVPGLGEITLTLPEKYNFILEQKQMPSFFPGSVESKLQKKSIDITTYYNQRSIDSLTNFFVDLSTFWIFGLLLITLKTDIIILKSFLLESIYSLSDTTKSFLLILSTDLLVGFHSPRGWELFLDSVLNHFGLPHNESFIFLFVATFPVLLDTFFKYWIFRYLSRISPSTVVTYHAMIE